MQDACCAGVLGECRERSRSRHDLGGFPGQSKCAGPSGLCLGALSRLPLSDARNHEVEVEDPGLDHAPPLDLVRGKALQGLLQKVAQDPRGGRTGRALLERTLSGPDRSDPWREASTAPESDGGETLGIECITDRDFPALQTDVEGIEGSIPE